MVSAGFLRRVPRKKAKLAQTFENIRVKMLCFSFAISGFWVGFRASGFERPKVGVTDRKSESQQGRHPESEPNRTENYTPIRFRCFYRKLKCLLESTSFVFRQVELGVKTWGVIPNPKPMKKTKRHAILGLHNVVLPTICGENGLT